jgi:hypothetical protein
LGSALTGITAMSAASGYTRVRRPGGLLRSVAVGGIEPTRSDARRLAGQHWAEVVRQEQLMKLEPLYRIRFTYPESWAVSLDGGWQQMFFLAEGRCEGWVTGRFRGANFPRKRARPARSGRTSPL